MNNSAFATPEEKSALSVNSTFTVPSLKISQLLKIALLSGVRILILHAIEFLSKVINFPLSMHLTIIKIQKTKLFSYLCFCLRKEQQILILNM